jgi:hypothetical protein
MMDDEQVWKKRFLMFALLRLAGVALFLLGIAIIFTDLAKPGGWPLLGSVLAITGAIDAVIAPRILKRSWERK